MRFSCFSTLSHHWTMSEFALHGLNHSSEKIQITRSGNADTSHSSSIILFSESCFYIEQYQIQAKLQLMGCRSAWPCCSNVPCVSNRFSRSRSMHGMVLAMALILHSRAWKCNSCVAWVTFDGELLGECTPVDVHSAAHFHYITLKGIFVTHVYFQSIVSCLFLLLEVFFLSYSIIKHDLIMVS